MSKWFSDDVVIPHNSNHMEQSTRNANYMPQQSCDRTRLAPRRLKQQHTNVFSRLSPSSCARMRVGSREPWRRVMGARGCISCRQPFASEHPVMSPGWRTGDTARVERVWMADRCVLGLLTDGKACRLHCAIFSRELVCRFSDAGPGKL